MFEMKVLGGTGKNGYSYFKQSLLNVSTHFSVNDSESCVNRQQRAKWLCACVYSFVLSSRSCVRHRKDTANLH